MPNADRSFYEGADNPEADRSYYATAYPEHLEVQQQQHSTGSTPPSADKPLPPLQPQHAQDGTGGHHDSSQHGTGHPVSASKPNMDAGRTLYEAEQQHQQHVPLYPVIRGSVGGHNLSPQQHPVISGSAVISGSVGGHDLSPQHGTGRPVSANAPNMDAGRTLYEAEQQHQQYPVICGSVGGPDLSPQHGTGRPVSANAPNMDTGRTLYEAEQQHQQYPVISGSVN